LEKPLEDEIMGRCCTLATLPSIVLPEEELKNFK